VVDQVGRDVTRFIMLTRKNDAPLDFDFDKVLNNPRKTRCFYVQYAHARIAIGAAQGATMAGIAVDDATLLGARSKRLEHEARIERRAQNRRMAASGGGCSERK
jgi:arginyl-tRNA synthetase